MLKIKYVIFTIIVTLLGFELSSCNGDGSGGSMPNTTYAYIANYGNM